MLTPEEFHGCKLPVSEVEYDHLALRGQVDFYPFSMDIGVFPAAAMPYIDGILEHGKTIFQQFFPKATIVSPVSLGFGR